MDKIYQLYISGKPLSFKSRGQVCYSKTHLCMSALKIKLYYMVYTITTINVIYFKLRITYKLYIHTHSKLLSKQLKCTTEITISSVPVIHDLRKISDSISPQPWEDL